MNGRDSGSPASACCMIGLAMSIGMAKPIPWAVSAWAVVTPTTRPDPSTSGPPLLPGLIAASVWIRSWRLVEVEAALSAGTEMSRPRAETIPDVTLLGYWRPSGLPIAMASWPTSSVAESPIGATARLATASILTMARSVRVSTP